jgi:small-conductance mechanosensitive channel
MRFVKTPKMPRERVAEMRGAASRQLRERARNARREAIVLAPLVIAVLLVYRYRVELFGLDVPVRVACSLALVALGWRFARDIGRAASPALFRRVDPGTAAIIGFLIRLFVLLFAIFVALRTAGLTPRTLAVGGAFTAVVLALAAQNTLGNVLAGLLLLSAQPFRVGDRVRLQSGLLAGQTEGVVMGLGLLYVTFAQGEDTVLIPNNIVIGSAIVPLREPAAVDLRARLGLGVKPSEVQNLLEQTIKTPTRSRPHISLEEVDDDGVVMRIAATPELDRDGPELADEILAIIEEITGREGVQARRETGVLRPLERRHESEP